MGTKTRKRGRDVPHPARIDETNVHRERPSRSDASASQSSRRAKKRDRMTPDVLRRINGATGSGARGIEPQAPQICMIYDDLAESLPVGVFGQYPVGLIKKILPWLRCKRSELLHVCGSLPPGEGIRVDVRKTARPDIVADGRQLPLHDASVKAVMIDPPYTEPYARDLYGTDYPRPAHLLAEAARVVRPGGVIAFVHYLVPMPPPGCTFLRAFGLSTGFGFPMRGVTLFAREQDQLPGVA